MERNETQAKSKEWNDRPIVRVEATVMVRGDLGFTPHLGYGNSRIAIYENLSRTEYLIYGYKIHDKTVTLDVLIPPQMTFTVATPIFHHWVIGNQRMGLSFNGTADARAFDRGVRVALENIEKAQMNHSTSSSEDANSISPSSIQSFNLGFADDPNISEPCLCVRPSPVSSLPRQQNTMPVFPAFSHQTLSTSAKKVITPPARKQFQRRHSSSLPGPSPWSVLSQNPTPPSSATEMKNFPVWTCGTSLSPLEFSEKSNVKEETFDFPSSRTRSSNYDNRHPFRQREDHRQHRSKRTKTPTLDQLNRQRDLQPTLPNSYVQFASRKSPFNIQYPQRQYLAAHNLKSGEDYRIPNYTRCYSAANRTAIMKDWGYQGHKIHDDSYWDYCGKSLYCTNANFNSYYDSKHMLKPQKLKGNDFRKHNKAKEDLGERLRCQNCLAVYNCDRNDPGSCPDAPQDKFERCIEYTSCLSAARCIFYHCFRDSEGNYVDEPCSCSSYSAGMSRRRRWLILGILSIFLPCLCLYPLLKSCHRCGVACHCCGGRHEPMSPPRDNQNSSPKR